MYDVDGLDHSSYKTVHDYRDPQTGKKGAKALAAVIGMSASTLQHKANPNDELAQLSLKEARSVMLGTGNFRILRELAAQLNFTAVSLPIVSPGSQTDVALAMAEWIKDTGETANAIKDALENEKLGDQALAGIERELTEDYQRGMHLAALLKIKRTRA